MAQPPSPLASQAGPPREGAEILCIGSELLLGSILNSNARWIAEQLAALGVPHFRQTVVGDNQARLARCLREASERCRLLICSGGLGPTPDDLTTETIAHTFGSPLQERPELLQTIEARHRRGAMLPGSRKQALLPRDATVLPNPSGTAPGLIWEAVPGFTLMTFPGVPAELRAMWQATAVPWIRRAGLSQGVFASRTLKFWGASEPALAAAVAPWLQRSNPTLAPYAGVGEVKLRLSVRAASREEAEHRLLADEVPLRNLPDFPCYGSDDETLASAVLGLLIRTGQTVAVAESCTGGGLGAALTVLPGSSAAVLGGVIAYGDRIKREQLGVSQALLEAHGAVSDAVARAMAEGVRQRLGSDWGIAVTGIAGPGGASDRKPVGLVHVAVAGPAVTYGQHRRFLAERGRNWIRQLAVGEALDQLRRALLEA
ncbi:MAG: competence/damage-inducible protein A [Aphanocapsa feldmannii 277cV]|uniref:CinA-like protein n=2 Tax=Aphanocapsa feldmannii TaxID=192050 RepID=A0A524RPJ4_9CHRO|nr:MAG: competence/damage-inducible protein A [Aphanocapsa feldmannii 277cV]TGH27605.1 MAG: competence/damage-inducible protein A [Aphanocapsa feldmannii 277cI]